MPDSNGNKTTNEWLMHIDAENSAAHARIEAKLDKKMDKEDHEAFEDRMRDVEKRTEKLAVKQAGISAVMVTVGVWLKSTIFGG